MVIINAVKTNQIAFNLRCPQIHPPAPAPAWLSLWKDRCNSFFRKQNSEYIFVYVWHSKYSKIQYAKGGPD